MFDIHYEGFVITYYTSWPAKQILSTLYVKIVRLSHAVIIAYITGLSYRQAIAFAKCHHFFLPGLVIEWLKLILV